MQSNREVFQEMREQEAQEQPPVIEEEKPKKFSSLERRVAAYEMKVLNNKVRKFGAKHVFKSQDKKRTDLSGVETRPLHNHAKPLTDVQKLYHNPEPKKEVKDNNLKDLKDGFKRLRSKSRDI